MDDSLPRLTFLATCLPPVILTASSTHLLETFDAVITVVDSHAVASAVLLVSGRAACVAWRACSSGRIARAFSPAQGVGLADT